MELNTAERFLFMIMHPEKSRYLIPEANIHSGLFGAILVDLSMEGKIEFKDKKVSAKSPYSKISNAHNLLLSKIAQSKRKKRIKTWISGLAWKSQKYRHLILHDLAMKGKIRIEEKRFLIFPYKRAYLIDRRGQQMIREEILEAIMNRQALNSDLLAILGLVDACKIHKVLTKDKKTLKLVKQNIKGLVGEDVLAAEVHQVIQEMQAAAVAVSVATHG